MTSTKGIGSDIWNLVFSLPVMPLKNLMARWICLRFDTERRRNPWRLIRRTGDGTYLAACRICDKSTAGLKTEYVTMLMMLRYLWYPKTTRNEMRCNASMLESWQARLGSGRTQSASRWIRDWAVGRAEDRNSCNDCDGIASFLVNARDFMQGRTRGMLRLIGLEYWIGVGIV